MPKASQQLPLVPIPRSRMVAGLLAISFILPFAILLPLMALDVRIGQGYFAFRYSPVRAARTARTAPVLAIAAAAGAGVWMLAKADRSKRRVGVALLGAAMLGAGGWVWWAPPSPMNQQFFNARSFSTDGAFVFEAEKIDSLPRYLRGFDDTLRQSPEVMGGTRVLSNPPGTTVGAYGLLRSFPPNQSGWFERILRTRYAIPAESGGTVAAALRFSIALTVLWVLSGAAAYGLGRVFLSPVGAAVFAIMLTFNPCTIHFVPGKDPAQLLTINAMLWAWFLGCKRRSRVLVALAGALLVIGSVFGLVHLWVALVALVATVWENSRGGLRESSTNAIVAALGASAVIVIVYLTLGWNIPATLFAVSSRWSELQRTFDMNRSAWFVIGLPIFLLFLSPGVWTLLGLSVRRFRLNFGTRLAICTIAGMFFIYVVMGVTYELPRLWVAFLPTLVLGLAIDSLLFRAPIGVQGEHSRVAKALVVIVIVQIAFTAFHWTLFDARESEYRLVSERYFN
ncbi:MAG: hypothetical protein ABIP55_15015 [Tepidisphaeraceae bacterium]